MMVIKNVPLDWWVSKALGLWLWGDKLGLLSSSSTMRYKSRY